MYTTFALHHITDIEHLPFSAADYSRFKFGDGQLAQQFGKALAEAFWKQHEKSLLQAEELVYVPSPYDAIPTASFAMATAFKDTLNFHLSQHNKASLLSSKIHRYKTYSIDYGSLNYEERLHLISSDTYHVDKGFLQNRTVIFLDDIRITGSHEKIIQRQLEQEGIRGKFHFLYFALLDNAHIPAHFENYLNYFEIDNIKKIAALFNKPHFLMNTRVIKYILHSDHEDVQWVMKNVPGDKLQELVAYALSNNYHLKDEYNSNLNSIIKEINYGH